MNKDLALCNPGNDVRNALKTMAQRQLRRLPVVDESGTLIGMLSLGDIAVRADDATVHGCGGRSANHRNRSRAAQREAFWSGQPAA